MAVRDESGEPAVAVTPVPDKTSANALTSPSRPCLTVQYAVGPRKPICAAPEPTATILSWRGAVLASSVEIAAVARCATPPNFIEEREVRRTVLAEWATTHQPRAPTL